MPAALKIDSLSCCRQPVQLEYFEDAVDMLFHRSDIKTKRGIGVSGISKGGELSLAMAAYLPKGKIGGAVAINSVPNFTFAPLTYKGTTLCKGIKKLRVADCFFHG